MSGGAEGTLHNCSRSTLGTITVTSIRHCLQGKRNLMFLAESLLFFDYHKKKEEADSLPQVSSHSQPAR